MSSLDADAGAWLGESPCQRLAQGCKSYCALQYWQWLHIYNLAGSSLSVTISRKMHFSTVSSFSSPWAPLFDKHMSAKSIAVIVLYWFAPMPGSQDPWLPALQYRHTAFRQVPHKTKLLFFLPSVQSSHTLSAAIMKKQAPQFLRTGWGSDKHMCWLLQLWPWGSQSVFLWVKLTAQCLFPITLLF